VRLAEAPSHGKPVLVYDPKSRGAESYLQLAKEIIPKHMPGFMAFPEPEKKEEEVVAQQVAAGAENQTSSVPRWKRWRERNKLVTMNLK
jgi:chromosome partitioning protein